MGVIAEGVETGHQLAALRHLRCDSAQGYHFSQPVDGSGALEFLSAARRW
jgi:EAL domain-containing protein (putative c-di-GMP-specific phosphodiesterase class I)